VGIVGAGFAADFHVAAYGKISSLDVQVLGIASRSQAKAQHLAARYGLSRVYASFADLLADPQINVVDLCVPVHVHAEMAIAAASAGKHVVCEKPLLGFVGQGTTPKREMYRQVKQQLRAIRCAFERYGVYLLYAENWVYAPGIQRGMELIAASGGTILDIRGHESHSGSASQFAKRWETSGGGSLLRLGIHPLSAAIYLKQWEGRRRGGKPIRVLRVYGQVADLTHSAAFRAEEWRWLATGWHDVENWSLGVLTFDDDSVAVISASDIALGGIESGLDVYLSNCRVRCNLSPNSACMAYAPDPSIFDGAALSEKLETGAGWSFPAVDHGWVLGYQQELQDFAEAVTQGRPPASGIELAEEAISVAYALYASAEQGRQLALAELDAEPTEEV
jgi:predicted dehydrogenase